MASARCFSLALLISDAQRLAAVSLGLRHRGVPWPSALAHPSATWLLFILFACREIYVWSQRRRFKALPRGSAEGNANAPPSCTRSSQQSAAREALGLGTRERRLLCASGLCAFEARREPAASLPPPRPQPLAESLGLQKSERSQQGEPKMPRHCRWCRPRHLCPQARRPHLSRTRRKRGGAQKFA